jgi:translation elongation factor P/translation initiation factor 5A
MWIYEERMDGPFRVVDVRNVTNGKVAARTPVFASDVKLDQVIEASKKLVDALNEVSKVLNVCACDMKGG